MSGLQLDFKLRTSPNCKTCHLVGSWDGYQRQLPLSKDRDGKAGQWRGTFRFTERTLQRGQRYWYYYVLDGYHAVHDPAREFVTERTTGRQLNILNVPSKSSLSQESYDSAPSSTYSSSSSRSGHNTASLPRGRPLSPSAIVHPRPSKPHEFQHLTVPSQSRDLAIESLSRRLAVAPIDSSDESEFASDSDFPSDRPSSDTSSNDSDSESDLHTPNSSRGISPPTLMNMSSGSESGRSSASSCRCQTFGITRSGQRIRLDCGGKKCGYIDDSSLCSGGSSSDDGREYKVELRKPSSKYNKPEMREARSSSEDVGNYKAEVRKPSSRHNKVEMKETKTHRRR